MKSIEFNTPLGKASLKGDASGICALTVSDGTIPEPVSVPAVLAEAVAQLRAYFEGSRQSFDLVLNPYGTTFQKRVWKALLDIPYGETVSYKELTLRLGDIKAIRAVASANARNPLWVIIPCHRVIGSDGSLTGYAGGLNRKKWLLELETPSRQHLLF